MNLCVMDLSPLLTAHLSMDWLDTVVATDASTVGMGVVATTLSPMDSERSLGEVRWSTIVSRRWDYEEHINVLECRAVVTAVRWLLSKPRSLHSRVFLLSDSQVVVGAVSKGRSSSFQILTRLRVRGGHSW